VHYLPHPDKRATGGEDASFVGADGLSVGVADGVGGWAEQGVDAGIYARMLMSNAQANAEATTAAQSAALETEPEAPATPGREEPEEGKLSRADVVAPLKVLVAAHAATPVQGSSTALVLLLRKSTLHGANLGDSGFMILRAGRILFKSEPQQHGFNFPFQCGSGPSDPPTSAQLYALPVQPGDIIVCGTDGLWDNLHDAEIAALVRSEMAAGRGPAGAAERIAAAAHIRGADPRADTPFSRGAMAARVPFRGGKMDDCTVVVSVVQEGAAAAASH
jgi:protein phosphatase PTC7